MYDGDNMTVCSDLFEIDFDRVGNMESDRKDVSYLEFEGKTVGQLNISKDDMETHFEKLMWEYHTDADSWTDENGRVVTEVSDE